MSGMSFRSAHITRIGAIVFENIEAGFLHKIFQFFNIGQPPFTPQTRGMTEKSSGIGFAGYRIDYIVFVADAAGTEQGITADFYSIFMGNPGQSFHF